MTKPDWERYREQVLKILPPPAVSDDFLPGEMLVFEEVVDCVAKFLSSRKELDREKLATLISDVYRPYIDSGVFPNYQIADYIITAYVMGELER